MPGRVGCNHERDGHAPAIGLCVADRPPYLWRGQWAFLAHAAATAAHRTYPQLTDRYVNTTGSLPNGLALDADGYFLARMYANLLPLGILELPVDIPKIFEVVQWQKANDTDQGLVWVVDTIARLAKTSAEFGLDSCNDPGQDQGISR